MTLPLDKALRDRLDRAFGLYDELAASIPEAALSQRLPGLPSNTLGQQLWCVVGARESYGRAIAVGEWQGFACSVTAEQYASRAAMAAALVASSADVLGNLPPRESMSERQAELLLDLLEHEVAHHGQLIRYLYALKLEIPAGWKSRYALG